MSADSSTAGGQVNTALVSQQPTAEGSTVTVNGVHMEAANESEVSSSVMNQIDDVNIEVDDDVSPCATVVPSNTPVTADSGQGSPNLQSSTESLNEDAVPDSTTGDALNGAEAALENLASNLSDTGACLESGQGEGALAASAPQAKDMEAKKLEKKEEKKRSKKKEDKGIEYILRALHSLQSPEEKLAALCKKYADLNEEHRALQTSFKTQQRTVTVVLREKDQLQAEHTRAMMAKSKLESLCRELQKHNKIIKEESAKRTKEDDEKRKEISQQFNTTIGEIQTQMNENTERNTKLRQENENMAAQLKAFINSLEIRDQQVEKLQKHHELEKKLFDAKLKQAEAILAENTEKGNKERELVMLKLAESQKKNTILEAQVSMFKERYSEFEQLHSRSSETFQKYKTEMDKMTKRIKKLEKDGLAWKSKWEKTNGALIEQVEARSKSEKETLTYAQKTRKLESLCRALQAELHNKKPSGETEGDVSMAAVETSEAPPNSPEASSSGIHSSEDIGNEGSDRTQPSEETRVSSPSCLTAETCLNPANVASPAESSTTEPETVQQTSPSPSSSSQPSTPLISETPSPVSIIGEKEGAHQSSTSEVALPTDGSKPTTVTEESAAV